MSLPQPGHAPPLLFLVLVAVAILAPLLQFFFGTWGIVLVQFLAFFAPPLLFARRLGFDVERTFLLGRVSLPRIAAALLAGIGTSVLATWVYGQVKQILGPSPLEESLYGLNRDPGTIFPLALVAIVAAPLTEEWLFRGFLLRCFIPWGKGAALWVPALYFALFHYDLRLFPSLLVTGLIFGLATLRSGRLLTALLAHVAHNATALFFIASLSHVEIVPDTVVPAALLLIAPALLAPPAPPARLAFAPQAAPDRRSLASNILLTLLLLALAIAWTVGTDGKG